MLKYKYIHPDNEENLKTYKYQGEDHSLISKYILSPLANFCLEKFVPEWIAPNVLTLMGFFCVIIPHFLILHYQPDHLEGNLPSWLLILTGVLHIVYMNFDNLDGKQARKTGNSSPLGLLFDHGCDALVIAFQGLSIATALQTGNQILSLGIYITGSTLFYVATLEEYYTDILVLPFINGPSEGCLIIAGFFIFTGFVGQNFWSERDTILPFARKEIAIAFFVIAAIVTAMMNFYKLYSKVRDQFSGALKNMSFFTYMIITIIFAFSASPTDVGSRKARILIYILGLNFGKLVGHLQMAHVSKSEFKQFRRTSFVIFTIINFNIISGLFFKVHLDEDNLLIILLITSLVVYAHLCINVIRQFTTVLNIRAFHVKKKDSANYNQLIHI